MLFPSFLVLAFCIQLCTVGVFGYVNEQYLYAKGKPKNVDIFTVIFCCNDTGISCVIALQKNNKLKLNTPYTIITSW